MEDIRYLRIEGENFGFLLEGLNEIKETDIKISNDDYITFFKNQTEGKCYKIKATPSGEGLFSYIEEYTPVINEMPNIESRIKALELALLEVL